MFSHIQYETELLESLDWDNDKLLQLFKYLDEKLNSKVLKKPNSILEEIKENFSYETSMIIKKMFVETVMLNNLHIAKVDDCEN